MPVARIITASPADCEELRRQLTTAGYSVKFAAPNEEFTDADIVVAAANVHRDYALQYAAEVAAEAGADIIVAPGVVAGSVESVRTPLAHDPDTPVAPDRVEPAAGVLFGTANEVKSAFSDAREGVREAFGKFSARAGDLSRQVKQKLDLAAERRRLEHEQREIEREEQRRVLQQQRMEAEARMAAEREQLRAQRQAELERSRREQEEMRRAMELERTRLATEQAAQTPAPPSLVEPAIPVPPPVITPVATPRPVAPAMRRPAPRPRPAVRRAPSRDRRFQKAAFVASIVALVAMVGFAVAMNIHPSSPIPHSMVQNPVQEKSPFGAASITPTTTSTGVAARTVARPVAALPQHDAAPVAKPTPQSTKPSPNRARHRAAADDYVADDEVVVHHYGQTAQQKHPPSAQTRAGIRRYSDRD